MVYQLAKVTVEGHHYLSMLHGVPQDFRIFDPGSEFCDRLDAVSSFSKHLNAEQRQILICQKLAQPEPSWTE